MKKSIVLNQDRSVISIIKDGKFKFISSDSFETVSSPQEYENLVGEVKIALPLFSSHIFFIVGADKNDLFPSNQLLIWDDVKFSKLAILKFSSEIQAISANTLALSVILKGKIMVFSLKNLILVHEIKNFEAIPNYFSMSSFENPIVSAVKRVKHGKESIAIVKYFEKEGVVGKYETAMLRTVLDKSQMVRVAPGGQAVGVVNILGNIIHVFSSSSLSVIYCVKVKKEYLNIHKLTFSPKCTLMLVYGKNIKVYNLSPSQTIREFQQCECTFEEESDSELDSLEEELIGKEEPYKACLSVLEYKFDMNKYKQFGITRRNEDRTHFVLSDEGKLRIIDDCGIAENLQFDFKNKQVKRIDSFTVDL